MSPFATRRRSSPRVAAATDSACSSAAAAAGRVPPFPTLAATDRELSVVYMGETLARCALPQHPPDNGDPWHDVLISYQTEEEGGDVGLRVEFDRVPCVARLVLDHWRPQPSWRFGLAAASSEPDGVRHYVRRLVVRTGSRVQSSQIPLAVSPNAQQWSAPIDVAYTGPPTISALAPRTGPIDGGTLLALSGHALHGSRPLCRLADHPGRAAANASASFDVYGALRRSDGAIVCELPAAADLPAPLRERAALYVHLAPNGQQFTSEAPPFVWTDAEIGAAHPQSSPAAGGAALTIGLSGLNASAVAAIRDEGVASCDFYTNTTLDPPARPAVALDPPYAGGERPAGTRPAGTRPDGGDVSDHTSTPATVDADGATLRCATPRRPAGDVALRVSLNGQQLTSQAEHAPPVFAFHGRLFEHSVSKPPVALIPPGGPAAAQHNRSATLPLLFPVALAAGSVVRCRFGTAETDGVLISNGSATLDLSDPLDALLDAGAAAQDWHAVANDGTRPERARLGEVRSTAANCALPSAAAAGAAWELWLTFGTAADHADNWEGAREAAAAGGLELGGDAIIDRGQLRLTRAGDPSLSPTAVGWENQLRVPDGGYKPYDATPSELRGGYQTLDRYQSEPLGDTVHRSGSAVLTMPPGTHPFHIFVSFQLIIAGGTGGDGMSLSYGGSLTTREPFTKRRGHIGEEGAGLGVRVLFRTARGGPSIEVWHDGAAIAAKPCRPPARRADQGHAHHRRRPRRVAAPHAHVRRRDVLG